MTAVSSSEPTSALTPAERRISRRIAAISESATLAVDAKAKALKAAGKPVIGFGAGEPDFATPDYIVEAAVAACRQPAMHRYTPAGGLPALKEAIVAKTARDSGFSVTPATVLVTSTWPGVTTYPESRSVLSTIACLRSGRPPAGV